MSRARGCLNSFGQCSTSLHVDLPHETVMSPYASVLRSGTSDDLIHCSRSNVVSVAIPGSQGHALCSYQTSALLKTIALTFDKNIGCIVVIVDLKQALIKCALCPNSPTVYLSVASYIPAAVDHSLGSGCSGVFLLQQVRNKTSFSSLEIGEQKPCLRKLALYGPQLTFMEFFSLGTVLFAYKTSTAQQQIAKC